MSGVPAIRAATAADRAAIESLLTDAALPTEGVAEILGRAPGDFVVAVNDAGDVVGAGGLEVTADGALLRSVVVADAMRGTGVGAGIVERLVRDADARALPLYLLTTTAAPWFPRFGFARFDRAAAPGAIAATWEFRVGCAQTAVAMRRPVTRA